MTDIQSPRHDRIAHHIIPLIKPLFVVFRADATEVVAEGVPYQRVVSRVVRMLKFYVFIVGVELIAASLTVLVLLVSSHSLHRRLKRKYSRRSMNRTTRRIAFTLIDDMYPLNTIFSKISQSYHKNRILI